MAKDSTPGRCLNCRSEVQVPNSFAEGDTLVCGTCGMSLKVLRSGAAVRLPIADVAPLRDEIRAAQQRLALLEHELQRARASFGIGANGLGLGLLYAVVKVAIEEQPLTRHLLLMAVAIAVVTGVALEAANTLFLAKRREITRLSGEVARLQAEIKQIQQKIRDSLRR
jgi:hypothetical protein